MQRYTHPFSPFIDKDSRLLILGTFPSITSFEENFYYAHPKNLFWRLLADVFGAKTPQTIEEKKTFLKENKIALWDVVKSCKRKNSLDSNLKEIEPNDIEGLLRRYPNIQTVFFTSKTAQKIYAKHFSHLPHPTHYLVSPSPAYAILRYEEKLARWKEVFAKE